MIGCSPADPTGTGTTGDHEDKLPLGSLSSVVERLERENPARSRSYRFPIGSGAELPVLVEAYDEEDGRISMSGRAASSQDSEFILKLTEGGLYGWVVDREQDRAWEITTGDDGKVAVAAVPVTKIFPVCPVPHDHGSAPAPAESPSVFFNATGTGFPGHVGSYPGTDVMTLQSRPESQKVLYLDFTDTVNGSEPLSGHTKEDMWVAWSISAARHYSFDVNVTTDPDVYAAAGVTNSACVTIEYDDIGAGSSCGLNFFGTRRCCNNHLYRDGYATGRIIDHEAGHGWGLLHDGGDNGGEYFNGFSEFQWTPLMGNVWPGDRWQQGLFQFSLGEYTSATQRQDDFQIITRTLDYVPDDIPNTTPLVLDGTSVAAEKNWGQIAENTDSDSFTFEIGPSGGHATLRVDRIEHRGGSMLDVQASLEDAMGAVVAEGNAAVARHADLDLDLPAGRYTLIVEGGGEGTPQRGFSRYSSMGLYSISGTVTGGVPTGGGMGGMGGMAGAAGMGGASGMAGAGGGLGGASGASGMAGMPPGGSTGQAGAGAGGAAAGASSVSGAGGGAGMAAGSGGATSTGGVAGMSAGPGPGATPPASPPSTEEASGCGCRVAGAPSTGAWWAPVLVGVAGVFVRRRRRCKP